MYCGTITTTNSIIITQYYKIEILFISSTSNVLVMHSIEPCTVQVLGTWYQGYHDWVLFPYACCCLIFVFGQPIWLFWSASSSCLNFVLGERCLNSGSSATAYFLQNSVEFSIVVYCFCKEGAIDSIGQPVWKEH